MLLGRYGCYVRIAAAWHLGTHCSLSAGGALPVRRGFRSCRCDPSATRMAQERSPRLHRRVSVPA